MSLVGNIIRSVIGGGSRGNSRSATPASSSQVGFSPKPSAGFSPEPSAGFSPRPSAGFSPAPSIAQQKAQEQQRLAQLKAQQLAQQRQLKIAQQQRNLKLAVLLKNQQKQNQSLMKLRQARIDALRAAEQHIGKSTSNTFKTLKNKYNTLLQHERKVNQSFDVTKTNQSPIVVPLNIKGASAVINLKNSNKKIPPQPKEFQVLSNGGVKYGKVTYVGNSVVPNTNGKTANQIQAEGFKIARSQGITKRGTYSLNLPRIIMLNQKHKR